MTAMSAFRATVYFITGLVLLFCVIQPSHAAPKELKQQLVHPEMPQTRELANNVATKEKQQSSTRVISSLKNIVSPRALKLALGFGADKATTLMTGVENFLNAKSDIEPIDRFMSHFNNIFLSKGGIALNNYYNIFANFWVNFDAIAQFVRGIENRIVVRRAEALAAAAEEESNAVVEETLLSLTAANAQLEDFKNNLSNLLRRHDIARIIEKSRRDDGVDDNKDDDDDDKQEDEDQNEENVNSITHQQVNSPADQMNQRYPATEYINDDINDIDLSNI